MRTAVLTGIGSQFSSPFQQLQQSRTLPHNQARRTTKLAQIPDAFKRDRDFRMGEVSIAGRRSH
jgi:hypothetical protein